MSLGLMARFKAKTDAVGVAREMPGFGFGSCFENQPCVGKANSVPLGSLSGQRCMRSEEHTSELQSLMRISYAVFCLKKKINHIYYTTLTNIHTPTPSYHLHLMYEHMPY